MLSFVWFFLFIQIQINIQHRDSNTKAIHFYESIHLLCTSPTSPLTTFQVTLGLLIFFLHYCLHYTSWHILLQASITPFFFSFSCSSSDDPIVFFMGSSFFVHFSMCCQYPQTWQRACEVVIIFILKDKQRFVPLFIQAINISRVSTLSLGSMLSAEDTMSNNKRLCSPIKLKISCEKH